MKTSRITQSGLEAMCLRWQGILQLMDWDVRIRFVRVFNIGDGKQGTVAWIRTKKKATIKVLDPRDYPTEGPDMWPQDVELCVVHELLHIHFACIDDFKDLSEMLFEQAIDAISQALVDRDRA